jgi:hypothetical protein
LGTKGISGGVWRVGPVRGTESRKGASQAQGVAVASAFLPTVQKFSDEFGCSGDQFNDCFHGQAMMRHVEEVN